MIGATCMLGVCALIAPGLGAAGAAGAAQPSPNVSRRDSGISYMAITHARSAMLEYAAGENHDKLLGAGASTYTIRAVFDNTGIHLTVKPVVFYTANGSLTGTATGTATVKATGETVVGRLSLTRGRGGQKGHRFSGTFTAKSDSTFKFLTLTYKGIYR